MISTERDHRLLLLEMVDDIRDDMFLMSNTELTRHAQYGVSSYAGCSGTTRYLSLRWTWLTENMYRITFGKRLISFVEVQDLYDQAVKEAALAELRERSDFMKED